MGELGRKVGVSVLEDQRSVAPDRGPPAMRSWLILIAVGLADDRFIAKEISRLEMDALTTFAPAYFKYMNECLDEQVSVRSLSFHARTKADPPSVLLQRPTALAKIFGVYKLGYKSTAKGTVRMNVMVMVRSSTVWIQPHSTALTDDVLLTVSQENLFYERKCHVVSRHRRKNDEAETETDRPRLDASSTPVDL